MSALRKYENQAQHEKDYNLAGLKLLSEKLLETSGAESLLRHFGSFSVNDKRDLENLTMVFIRLFGYNWTELLKFQSVDASAPTLVPKLENVVPFVMYIEQGSTDDLAEASDKKWVQWSPGESLDSIPNAIFTNFKFIKVFGKEGAVDANLEVDLEQLFIDLNENNLKSREFEKWKAIYTKFNARKVYFNKALNRNKKINDITGLEYQRRFGNEPYAIPPKGIGEDGKGYQRLFKTQKGLPFFEKEVVDFGNSKNPIENKIIWGDNLAIMRDLPDESVDLIYIDPPFFSGRDYNYIFKDKSEVKTFTDIWDQGLDGYLVWMNARLWEMKKLLKPTGGIFVHLDWHAVHYVKVEMDKIFGYDNFQNSISWCYKSGGASKSRFSRKHDHILYYAKDMEKNYFKVHKEKSYMAPGSGKNPAQKYFSDEKGSFTLVNPKDWWDVGILATSSHERIGYPTQKPEELIEKVIQSSSKPGDIVADFFCGGGTTAAVAEKLGRKWITTDISRIAVATARDRIANIYENNIGIKKISKKPKYAFSLEYHGSYEKKDILAMNDQEHIEFVLKCYGAKFEKDGHSIHGYKADIAARLTAVHIDLSRKKIERETVEKFHRAIKNRGDDYENGGIILCWGFTKSALSYVKKVQKDAYGSSLKIVQIDLLDIDGPDFTDSNIRFLNTPTPNFQIKDQQGLAIDFDATTSLLEDGREVVYYQWDFDFSKTFKPMMSKSLFTRDIGGDGNPLNDNRTISYEFPKKGKYKVALQIYDEDGGTSQVVKEVEV